MSVSVGRGVGKNGIHRVVLVMQRQHGDTFSLRWHTFTGHGLLFLTLSFFSPFLSSLLLSLPPPLQPLSPFTPFLHELSLRHHFLDRPTVRALQISRL